MERFKGFEVFTAPSFKEGASLFKEISFDLVLCGHKLPDGDGLEVLRGWTRAYPKLIAVLMTAHNDEQLRREAEKAGIRGYLEKPFDLKQLEDAIGISDFASLSQTGIAKCGINSR